MKPRRRGPQVSTFPFLAVLLCTMGSLILLLLVIDRRAKAVAKAKALQAAARLSTNTGAALAARQAEWRKRREALHQELARQDEDVQAALTVARRNGLANADKLRQEQVQIQNLQDRIRNEISLLGEEEKKARQEQNEFSLVTRRESESQQELALLTRQLLDLERTLVELKIARARQEQMYSLIPYRGTRGDARRPLYVECQAGGLVFHPDRLTIEEGMLAGIKIREEVLRRIESQRRTHYLRAEDAPYLLMLVRPDGIATFYSTQAALQGLKIDFGYEFVERDWVLDFPDGNGTEQQQPWMVTNNSAKALKSIDIPSSTKSLKMNRLSGQQPSAGSTVLNSSGGGVEMTAKGGAFPGNDNSTIGSSSNGNYGNGFPDLRNTSGTISLGNPGVGNGKRSEDAQRGSGAWPSGGSGPDLQSGLPDARVSGFPQGAPGEARGGSGSSVIGLPRAAASLSHNDPIGFQGQVPLPAPTARSLGIEGNAIPRAVSNSGQAGTSPGTGENAIGMPPPIEVPPSTRSNVLSGQNVQSPPSEGVGGEIRSGSGSGPRLTTLSQSLPTSQGRNAVSTAPSSDAPSTSSGGSNGDGAGQRSYEGNPQNQAKDDGSDSRINALLSGPAATREVTRQSRSIRTMGSRDWTILVECKADGIVISPTAIRIALDSLESLEGIKNPLLGAVQQLIARKQATVMDGEAPYRPLIRFVVWPEGLRTYYQAYPALEPLRTPMSRENIIIDKDGKPQILGK